MITHLQYYNLGLGFQLLHLQVLELSLTPDKTKWINPTLLINRIIPQLNRYKYKLNRIIPQLNQYKYKLSCGYT